jgi:hypothetical protein
LVWPAAAVASIAKAAIAANLRFIERLPPKKLSAISAQLSAKPALAKAES